MEPIDILKWKLHEYEVSLQKSKDAYEQDLIPKIVHEDHVNNLIPKISKYNKAIDILKTYTE